MLAKKLNITTILKSFAVATIILSAIIFTAGNDLKAEGASDALCSFRIDVYQDCMGGLTPQAGATVTVTYYDGWQDTQTTNSSGQAFFGCHGPTVAAIVTYGNTCGYLCKTEYSNGSIFTVCMGGCVSNPCPEW